MCLCLTSLSLRPSPKLNNEKNEFINKILPHTGQAGKQTAHIVNKMTKAAATTAPNVQLTFLHKTEKKNSWKGGWLDATQYTDVILLGMLQSPTFKKISFVLCLRVSLPPIVKVLT